MSKNLGYVADIMSAYNVTNFKGNVGNRLDYLSKLSSTLLEVVAHIKKPDDRYTVVYDYLGAGMHNYQALYDGERIGWGLNQDNAWYICASHYLTGSK